MDYAVIESKLEELHLAFDAFTSKIIEVHQTRFAYYINHLPRCPKCGSEGYFEYKDFHIGEDKFKGACIQCTECLFKVEQPTCIIGPDFKLFKRWDKGDE